jgi:hypothetical protein
VLNNDIVLGAVNANRHHYESAASVLAAADVNRLSRLITRRVPLKRWVDAMEYGSDDIKVLVDFTPCTGTISPAICLLEEKIVIHVRSEALMSDAQFYFLGIMSALAPSMIIMVILLWRADTFGRNE